jgi:hypothetical protein
MRPRRFAEPKASAGKLLSFETAVVKKRITCWMKKNGTGKQRGLIVISSLKKIDPVVANEVYKAMLLGKTTRPDAGGEIFERFGFANACKGITHDGLDQVERTHGGLKVDFDPVAEVFPELRLEYSFSTLYFQGQVPSGVFPELKALPQVSGLVPKKRGAVAHSLGSA